jgi:hypothetical protein
VSRGVEVWLARASNRRRRPARVSLVSGGSVSAASSAMDSSGWSRRSCPAWRSGAGMVSGPRVVKAWVIWAAARVAAARAR